MTGRRGGGGEARGARLKSVQLILSKHGPPPSKRHINSLTHATFTDTHIIILTCTRCVRLGLERPKDIAEFGGEGEEKFQSSFRSREFCR